MNNNHRNARGGFHDQHGVFPNGSHQNNADIKKKARLLPDFPFYADENALLKAKSSLMPAK